MLYFFSLLPFIYVYVVLLMQLTSSKVIIINNHEKKCTRAYHFLLANTCYTYVCSVQRKGKCFINHNRFYLNDPCMGIWLYFSVLLSFFADIHFLLHNSRIFRGSNVIFGRFRLIEIIYLCVSWLHVLRRGVFLT